VGDQVQQLGDFGLEGKGLFLAHGLLLGWQAGTPAGRWGNRQDFQDRSAFMGLPAEVDARARVVKNSAPRPDLGPRSGPLRWTASHSLLHYNA
jgi:hypothetical protein